MVSLKIESSSMKLDNKKATLYASSVAFITVKEKIIDELMLINYNIIKDKKIKKSGRVCDNSTKKRR